MRYAYIDSLRGQYPIVKMCLWCGVSKSGYYDWRDRPLSDRDKYLVDLEKVLIEQFARFKRRYGSVRLTIELNELGYPCCENTVAKLMAKNGLKARNGKNYKYFPSVLANNHVSDNLIARDFSASCPDEKWVSDITYIRINRGFVYLAVVMDLFSRKIIGWSPDDSMTNQLIIDAFDMAEQSRDVQPGLILHSDRGIQYRSGEYQALLYDNQIQPSMSRKGNCWDNAAMESFFGRLKVESIYAEDFKTKQEAYSCVFEYIEMFYNRIRRHSYLNYVSPDTFEKQYYEIAA